MVPKQLFPELETERLLLREISEHDTEGIFQNFSDEEITDIIGMGKLSKMDDAKGIVKEFQEYHGKGTGIAWAVVLKEGNQFIGTCTYEELDKRNNRAEIGYDLLREHWGNGYMDEALEAILTYGFTELGLNRIDAHTFTINTKSRNLLKRVGFVEEGILRENIRFKEEYRSEAMYSVLQSEWKK
ncbi:MAG: GNAT family N-acetyltransferase [Candidatus Thorarchaeota archaeon]|jgi:ribosomal-protein-alanine N-acetyltransferase